MMSTSERKLGIVWANGKGLVFLSNYIREILTKPKFPFDFDALYYEPGLSHKVIADIDYPLTKDEINKIDIWLMIEDRKPELVNGVDKDGKYIEGVTKDQVARVVSFVPDIVNSWRLDMNSPTPNAWIQGIRLDKDGNNLGFGPEDEAYAVVTEPVPESHHGEEWKWDFKKEKWVDKRSKKEILQFLKQSITENAKFALHIKLLNESISVQIPSTSEFIKVGIDNGTIENINHSIDSELLPILWYPKGSLEPVNLTIEDLKVIKSQILKARKKFNERYFEHKIAINTETSPEKLKKYDVYQGYD